MSIDFVKNLCIQLPATSEDVKWGNDLCFSVGGKMYCAVALEGSLKVSFKCDDEDFAALTERENIIPAAYAARHKWVTAKAANALKKNEWELLIKKAYSIIKSKLPKKTQEQIDLS